MNLKQAAQAEQERRTHSKLEPHCEAIFTLRRKHWSYSEITKWLNQHGVSVTLSSVHRFCERAIARRPRNAGPPTANVLETLERQPLSLPSSPPPQPKKHRFNVEP